MKDVNGHLEGGIPVGRAVAGRQSNKNPSAVLVLLTLFVVMTGCAGREKTVDQARLMKDKWGIEITRLHLTANGYMIDLRYRVRDATKAKELFVGKNKPMLIDQKSGKVLTVPNMGKIGPLRNSNAPKQGKIYWMFFNNMSGLIQPGSMVTVVIGAFRAEDLVVR
ncbi:MAG TPA: hypothetical protein ENK89_02005 [Desulfobulbaceae bacterium]|nr:hypothetical protein [Desulfobulbaceae bacterium]